MFISSLKHILFSLVWVAASIVAIPVILIFEIFYFVFSFGLFIFSIPFSAYKGVCRMISETMYLKVKSWETTFTNKFDKFIEDKSDKVDEVIGDTD